MKRIRTIIMLGAVAAFSVVPAATTPANASHRCGLEDISGTVNTICENYHTPKAELAYLVCIAKGECPID
jgi:hypothetical protein